MSVYMSSYTVVYAVYCQRRHKTDKKVNNRTSTVLRQGCLVKKYWSQIIVGDIVLMKIDEQVPVSLNHCTLSAHWLIHQYRLSDRCVETVVICGRLWHIVSPTADVLKCLSQTDYLMTCVYLKCFVQFLCGFFIVHGLFSIMKCILVFYDALILYSSYMVQPFYIIFVLIFE